MLDGLSEPMLAVDVDSGVIVDCNAAAASLLRVEAAVLRGQLWRQSMSYSAGADNMLAHALQANKRLMLPPFLVHLADATEVILGGLLLPRGIATNRIVTVLLWQLVDQEQLHASGSPGPADTLAVLGLDQLPYGASWSEEDNDDLMNTMRAMLLGIVRAGDRVSVSFGAAIVIVLRDINTEGARDISVALLSHLRREHARSAYAHINVRMSFGLAFRAPGDSALDTLLAANNALMQAQWSGAKEPIVVAAADHYALLIGRMMHSAGALSAPFVPAISDADSAPEAEKEQAPSAVLPAVAPIEKDIEGYVVDNMEGAVDQAIFLAKLDLPVAIIGPAGTGKMYIAKIIHEESGGAEHLLVPIDCRDFRSRSAAHKQLAAELAQGEGKTLVFKSPHLLHPEVQMKLARQVSSRTLADVSPPQYLPQVKLIALFPDQLEVLIRRRELTEPLASAFAGYPINIPPINARKQAVLRWAHKILGQEGVLLDRDMKGFTPDAEQAMLQYDWPGNISEMRQCIHSAMEKTSKDWLTPVDLGLFSGLDSDGTPLELTSKPFLAVVDSASDAVEAAYLPSALEAVHSALGEAVHALLELDMIKPLGLWVEDELVLAAVDRYRGDLRRAGEFLHTKPRNVSRWLPKIAAREGERSASALWQKSCRLIKEWVRESPQAETSPVMLLTDILLRHVTEQGGTLSSANRARIMGVSTPTYLKRLREVKDR